MTADFGILRGGKMHLLQTLGCCSKGSKVLVKGQRQLYLAKADM